MKHTMQFSSNHSLPGPDNITRVQLPNGIVVLSRANFNSPSVFISGRLFAGALFDPDEKLGLADFTASALMRGSEQRDFQQIYDTLESTGASLGISCGTHTASFNGKALVEDLDALLNLLAEVLRQPVFPSEQVERLRAQLLTVLAIRAQDTGGMAGLAFDQIVYEGHPYRRPDDGYPETISAIQQADLAAFHQKHYGPRGALVAIVGGLDPAKAAEKVARTLGDWENPGQPDLPALPPVKPLQQTTTQKVIIPGKSQADIVIGAAGPERRSPDFLAAALGNNVLGQFGMMGRIGESVREKSGLAYYASSSLGGGPGPGSWDISAGVAPENVERVIDLIVQEVRRFVSEPVGLEELKDSQASYIGHLPLTLESNAGVAGALIYLERYDLGLDYYLKYDDTIRAIHAQDVLEAAQRYLDADRLAVAVAGP
ncbi:MAG: insulinase family protein [Anaerolineales bacterium]|nr:insulinase family protein [Anaerolineales bacterium]